MDFAYYASSGLSSIPITSQKRNRNYDHFFDPYIRRYFITKIAINSLSLGLLTYLAKTFVQNIRNRKFYKLSPWIELAVVTGTFSLGLSQKFKTNDEERKQMSALRQFKQNHFFNSQYWH